MEKNRYEIGTKRKMISSIKEELTKNELEIKELQNKIEILQENSFETRMLFVCMFTMIPWALLTLNMETLANFLPLKSTFISYIPALVSGTIGLCCQKVYSKIRRSKERLKQFSHSISQKERKEEQMRYEVKKQALETYSQVLTEKLPIVERQENMDIQIRYPKKESFSLVKTIQKYILQKNFSHIRNKEQEMSGKVKFLGFGMAVTTIFFCFPSVGLFPIEDPIIFFLIGGVTFGGYQINKDYQDRILFKKLNAELGVDSLKEEAETDEEEILASELRRRVRELKDQIEIIKPSTPMKETPNFQEKNFFEEAEIAKEKHVKGYRR